MGYSNASCGGQVAAVPNTGNCVNTAASPPLSFDVMIMSSVSGSCNASGGTPTGSVDPTGETTFCCQP